MGLFDFLKGKSMGRKLVEEEESSLQNLRNHLRVCQDHLKKNVLDPGDFNGLKARLNKAVRDLENATGQEHASLGTRSGNFSYYPLVNAMAERVASLQQKNALKKQLLGTFQGLMSRKESLIGELRNTVNTSRDLYAMVTRTRAVLVLLRRLEVKQDSVMKKIESVGDRFSAPRQVELLCATLSSAIEQSSASELQKMIRDGKALDAYEREVNIA